MVVRCNFWMRVFRGCDLEHGAKIAMGRELPFLPKPFLCAGVYGAVYGFGRPYDSALSYSNNEEQREVYKANSGDVYLVKPAGADDKLEW